MNNEELILVTGATGFLGMRLVRELLDRQPDANASRCSSARQPNPASSAPTRSCPPTSAIASRSSPATFPAPTAASMPAAYQPRR
jgi:nucleoside-diphosphate-sugar epimerase